MKRNQIVVFVGLTSELGSGADRIAGAIRPGVRSVAALRRMSTAHHYTAKKVWVCPPGLAHF